MRRSLAVTVAALALLSLAGCGKAGRPQQPPDSVYPRIYPNPADTPATVEQKKGRAMPPEWDQKDLEERFTEKGSYIDPSTRVMPGSQMLPASSLPNTTVRSQSDPFSQSMGSSSTLPPVRSSSPSDTEDEQQ
ncbi:MAG: hypothetical protein F8N37_02345 [Telmatospirillum sp.]|nr:hypothetical protein [Telmatospirillum sp.]